MTSLIKKIIGIAAVFASITVGTLPLEAAVTQVTLVGEIQSISVASSGDVWSKGVIAVGGMNVIIPRNLIIQLPVSRYTLQELFTQAPESCRAAGQTGLARSDSCFNGYRGAIATILANRQDTGEVIAGEVKIEKAAESLMGVVTYINYSDGYFRLNGLPNDPKTGVMVRLNDPIARHTVQTGLGCANAAASGSNCSPDIRFGVDNDNYTAAFATGVPLCLPSAQIGEKRTVGANPVDGAGDPFCPLVNRTQDPVINPIPDATAFLFVPLVLGDSMAALGSFEIVNGVKFFSAHTLQLHTRVMTKPGNPDYMTLAESELDVAGFTNQRARLLVIGFTSLTDSQLDIYGLHIDPLTNQPHEVVLASTVGNPLTVNRGLPPFGGSIFKVNYDVDFVVGPNAKRSPCIILANAGFLPGGGGCSGGSTVDIANNFAVLSPISREIIGRTRNKLINKIGSSTDISGNSAPNGQYQAPLGVSHAEPIEFNLGGLQTPLVFTGEPWLLDRRLGPDGCRGTCESTPQPLDPWPWDGGLDPRTQNPPAVGVPTSVADRILSYVTKAADGTFGFNGGLLSLPKAQSPVVPLQPTPVAAVKQCK